jgi:hypothetical protein
VVEPRLHILPELLLHLFFKYFPCDVRDGVATQQAQASRNPIGGITS